jgi:hypothetical protein
VLTFRCAFAAIVLTGAMLLPGCTAANHSSTPIAPTPVERAVTESAEYTGSTGSTGSTDESTASPTAGSTAEPAQASDDRAVVTPFIAYAGPGTDPNTTEIAGFIPDVIEDGGTCTATVQGTAETASAPGYADATSTSCGLITLPGAPSGQVLVLSYSSDTSQGTSDPVTVTP